ncbi:MAG: hypothetical protein ACE5KX_02635 [Acidimicrobiia bacterium]
MSHANWGAIVVGAISGLGAGVILAVALLAVGVADNDTTAGLIILILVGFVGQLVAGYVAARFAGRDQAMHGSLAALSLFLVTAAISIVSGADPAVLALVFWAIVSAVLGTAGGVLAVFIREGGERRDLR